MPFLVQSFFRKFALLSSGLKFTSARDHKQMLTFRGVQFLDCISKISRISQHSGVFCFLKMEETLHSYLISDLRHIVSNLYHMKDLESPFLSSFLHIPDILFSVLPLNLLMTRTAWVLRHRRLLCERDLQLM